MQKVKNNYQISIRYKKIFFMLSINMVKIIKISFNIYQDLLKCYIYIHYKVIYSIILSIKELNHLVSMLLKAILLAKKQVCSKKPSWKCNNKNIKTSMISKLIKISTNNNKTTSKATMNNSNNNKDTKYN